MVTAGRMIDYEKLAEESWSRLWAGSDDPAHPMRLVVLATVDADGAPDARTMVLRGADRRLGKIWFYTDRRSEKIDHLRASGAVCVVAYDPADRIQLRLRGTATLYLTGTQADLHWRHVSLALKALFASSDPPGRPMLQPDPRLAGIQQSLDAVGEAGARANFAVIEVRVKAIEWLQVRDNEQRRAVLHAATGWAAQPLVP